MKLLGRLFVSVLLLYTLFVTIIVVVADEPESIIDGANAQPSDDTYDASQSRNPDESDADDDDDMNEEYRAYLRQLDEHYGNNEDGDDDDDDDEDDEYDDDEGDYYYDDAYGYEDQDEDEYEPQMVDVDGPQSESDQDDTIGGAPPIPMDEPEQAKEEEEENMDDDEQEYDEEYVDDGDYDQVSEGVVDDDTHSEGIEEEQEAQDPTHEGGSPPLPMEEEEQELEKEESVDNEGGSPPLPATVDQDESDADYEHEYNTYYSAQDAVNAEQEHNKMEAINASEMMLPEESAKTNEEIAYEGLTSQELHIKASGFHQDHDDLPPEMDVELASQRTDRQEEQEEEEEEEEEEIGGLPPPPVLHPQSDDSATAVPPIVESEPEPEPEPESKENEAEEDETGEDQTEVVEIRATPPQSRGRRNSDRESNRAMQGCLERMTNLQQEVQLWQGKYDQCQKEGHENAAIPAPPVPVPPIPPPPTLVLSDVLDPLTQSVSKMATHGLSEQQWKVLLLMLSFTLDVLVCWWICPDSNCCKFMWAIVWSALSVLSLTTTKMTLCVVCAVNAVIPFAYALKHPF